MATGGNEMPYRHYSRLFPAYKLHVLGGEMDIDYFPDTSLYWTNTPRSRNVSDKIFHLSATSWCLMDIDYCLWQVTYTVFLSNSHFVIFLLLPFRLFFYLFYFYFSDFFLSESYFFFIMTIWPLHWPTLCLARSS